MDKGSVTLTIEPINQRSSPLDLRSGIVNAADGQLSLVQTDRAADE
jgi:hypothetical protein